MQWKIYCSVIHPEIKKIGALPLWLARIIAMMTRDEGLKNDIPVIAYFADAGEPGDPVEANNILGAPSTTLDEWIKKRKAETERRF